MPPLAGPRVQFVRSDKPVLCAGSLLVDFRLAAHDTERVALLLGGTSGNTAFGLARLEVKTTILAKVGDDYFGRLLRDDMASVGVDTSLISLHATAPTMVNMAVVEPQGARNMFTWPDDGGALWRIEPEDVPDGLASSVGWAHFCGATLERDPAGRALGRLAEECAKAAHSSVRRSQSSDRVLRLESVCRSQRSARD